MKKILPYILLFFFDCYVFSQSPVSPSVCDSLTNQLQIVQDKYSEAYSQYTTLKDEVNQLSENIKSSNIKKMREEEQALRQQIERLNDSIQNLQNTIKAVEHQISEMQTQNTVLAETNIQLQKDEYYGLLRKRYSDLTEDDFQKLTQYIKFLTPEERKDFQEQYNKTLRNYQTYKRYATLLEKELNKEEVENAYNDLKNNYGKQEHLDICQFNNMDSLRMLLVIYNVFSVQQFDQFVSNIVGSKEIKASRQRSEPLSSQQCKSIFDREEQKKYKKRDGTYTHDTIYNLFFAPIPYMKEQYDQFKEELCRASHLSTSYEESRK